MNDSPKYFKYPRTPHLPWSLGRSADDISLDSIGYLELLKDIVVTEKLDGENTTLYRDYIHARSIDSQSHPARDWVKKLHATIRHDIPEYYRICGENLFAKHSIYYDRLTTYFYVYSIYQEDICLSWDETLEWCELLGLSTVPILYSGPWNEIAVKACWTGKSAVGDSQEGYVVRNAERFDFDKFRLNVAKFVRADHVQSEEHWIFQEITPNKLKNDK
jgi:hypothetical protein